MSWKQWLQLIAALVVLLVCILLGHVVWPALQAMAPVIAWTLLFAVEIIVVSIALGVPLAIIVFLNHHRKMAEVRIIEARKLPANERGFIGGFVTQSHKDRILVPQLTAYSQEVPGHVHIQEDHSNSAVAANELRREQFEWKKHIDMLRINQPQEVPSNLPSFVPYEQVKHLIPAGHALLGANEEGGVDTCEFKELMTMWIVGGSNMGKSNTVALKVDEAIRDGRNTRIILIDPHKWKPDSLYNKIRCYESRFLFAVASEPEEILQVLTWFSEEFLRRRNEPAAVVHDDILLIVDEVPSLMEPELPASKRSAIPRMLVNIARICGQQSRGFGMFGWFISQNAAGMSWLRNMVLTVIAHKMNMMSERKLACNEDMEIARSMSNWPKGRIVVYGLNFETVRVLQMAAFSPPVVVDGTHEDAEADRNDMEEDLTPLVDYDEEEGRNTEAIRNISPFPTGNSQKGASVSGNAPFPKGVTDFQLDQINGMYEAGWNLRDIAPMVHLSGGSYKKFQAACAYLGIAVEQEA